MPLTKSKKNPRKKSLPVSDKKITDLQNQFLTAGVDEVGRGCLVGDVVVAAVILDEKKPIQGLMDSKKLTEKTRLILAKEIKEKALCWSVARCTPTEIDDINILQASLLAMKRAVESLSIQPEHVLVDGNKLPRWTYEATAIVKGDSRVAEISAASILAKVQRDSEMVDLDKTYPQYGFAQHKGYPTKKHLAALEKYGITEGYRLSYAPVKNCISKR